MNEWIEKVLLYEAADTDLGDNCQISGLVDSEPLVFVKYDV